MKDKVLSTISISSEFAQDLASNIVSAVNTTYKWAYVAYESVPGHQIIYKYIRSSYQHDPWRTALECCLVLFIVYYVFKKKYRPDSKNGRIKLSPREVDELVQEWEPEPLAPKLRPHQQLVLDKIPVITSANTTKPTVKDRKQSLVNFASFNFLGLLNSDKIREKSIAALRNYGVGTCGPPGFYGTVDVHMQLEQDLANYFGTDEAIIYSQAFSTIGSVIPAFAKRGDIIVADDGVCFSVQRGLEISRSTIRWFKHNDMADLERVLREIQEMDKKSKKPVTRRFMVVEGIYTNSGDIAPLPQLIELKKKYKYRLVVDESISFCALGKHGRGVTDYFNVPVKDVDIIVGSLANSLGSSGGFCTGATEIVDHQRLSGLAYCFSASLPALLAVAAREALLTLDENSGCNRLPKSDDENVLPVLAQQQAKLNNTTIIPQSSSSSNNNTNNNKQQDILSSLRENSKLLRKLLSAIPQLEVTGSPDSPVLHLRIHESERVRLGLSERESTERDSLRKKVTKTNNVVASFNGDALRFGEWWEEEERLLMEIIDEAQKENLLLTAPRYVVDQELFLPRPSIRMCVSAGHSKKDMEKAASVVKAVAAKVLGKKK